MAIKTTKERRKRDHQFSFCKIMASITIDFEFSCQ
jgi:hypothetical protein